MSGFRLPRFALMTALAAVLIPALALAGADAPRQHDRGFFLRLAAGVSSARNKVDVRPSEVIDGAPNFPTLEFKLSGTGGDGEIAIGALVGRNFAVHGTAFGWSVQNPKARLEGERVDADQDFTMSVSAFGPGVTGYFGQNFYLSGSLGVARLTLSTDNIDYKSETGYAAEVVLGKEWWVGRRWGLGVAAAGQYHSIGTQDFENDFKGTSFGLRFSATFN